MPIFHETTVPVFIHYLQRLEHMLSCLDAHGSLTGEDRQVLIRRSLAPGMFDLETQARCAIGFSQRAFAPLVPACGAPIEMGEGLSGLIQAAREARHRLEGVAPSELAGKEAHVCRDRAGEAEVVLAATDFIARYALPNFFFHLSMTYAIARAAGVPLGKGDFDGWHAYAPGFSFVGEGDRGGA
ncbi:DUF1993 family protein [Oryzibacter oryziterrae]|uniref:DUF1993 family protein n=1 Tax=Oryzibacter oryziterrae TaxID=2766474 RepID=UPI001F467C82|nr:DUF1993 family protein [Oryzibacter oryziterrae]